MDGMDLIKDFLTHYFYNLKGTHGNIMTRGKNGKKIVKRHL